MAAAAAAAAAGARPAAAAEGAGSGECEWLAESELITPARHAPQSVASDRG